MLFCVFFCIVGVVQTFFTFFSFFYWSTLYNVFPLVTRFIYVKGIFPSIRWDIPKETSRNNLSPNHTKYCMSWLTACTSTVVLCIIQWKWMAFPGFLCMLWILFHVVLCMSKSMYCIIILWPNVFLYINREKNLNYHVFILCIVVVEV